MYSMFTKTVKRDQNIWQKKGPHDGQRHTPRRQKVPLVFLLRLLRCHCLTGSDGRVQRIAPAPPLASPPRVLLHAPLCLDSMLSGSISSGMVSSFSAAHSLQRHRRRWWWHILAPPHSMQRSERRWCGQTRIFRSACCSCADAQIFPVDCIHCTGHVAVGVCRFHYRDNPCIGFAHEGVGKGLNHHTAGICRNVFHGFRVRVYSTQSGFC